MTEKKTILGTERASIVNNFCITFSTVNGSGSATANNIILRSLFRMGIPVSGKNIFPSNIQGLPTWYAIRVSQDGYLARLEKDDIVIAMNQASVDKEFDFIVPGGVLLYADDIQLNNTREDIVTYPMPVKKLIKEAEVTPALRDYLANMVYVGVLSHLLGIDLDIIHEVLGYHFKGKTKPIESNYAMVKAAADWAAANLEKRDVYRVEKMDKTADYIMMDGNTAGAIGSLYGGLQFVGWYPITPATTLAEAYVDYVPLLRTDPETGKQTIAVVQSEDELAAIGMVVGAGWAGLRAMTSTSGPGLSLMSEYLGMAYFAEIPVVVWDVQRVGPSTGMPTRTAQGDLTGAYFISHGDTQYILLIPGSVSECFEFGWRALDIAEKYQTPVIVMSDLDLGMNQWMTKKFEYPNEPINRGKVLWEEDLTKMIEERKGDWGRYLDIDGDGIPYRTVPGNRHPRSAYFTRGTGHDSYARYSEDSFVWEETLNRLSRKFETIRHGLPKPEIQLMEGASIGIIASGSADPAVVEARDLLAKAGIKTDYLRIKAIPFSDEVYEFIQKHEHTYVVELNHEGQLKQILTLSNPDLCHSLRKVAHTDGMPLTADWVRNTIIAQEEK